MKRIFVFLAVLVLSAGTAFAVESTRHTVRYRGYEREYWLSVPDNAGADTPLIVCLHGYGGKAEGYKPDMVKAALDRGYAICCPQGLKAPKGKTGWNVRYPKQEGMTVNDVAFVVFLAGYLPKNHGLNRVNVFMTGMSNGGEMCYVMALSHPETFRAIASMAGLQMGWTVDELNSRKPVPFMEVHGTGDKTSRWEGDPDNKYGWGAYLPVPVAVANMVSHNRCRLYSRTELPLLKEGANRVILHSYTMGAGGTEVLFYEVQGGTHSWATDAFDSYGAILDFFDRYKK